MDIEPLSLEDLASFHLSPEIATNLCHTVNELAQTYPSREQLWQFLSKKVLAGHYPFDVHLYLFNHLFPKWHEQIESAPAWLPEPTLTRASNIASLMSEVGHSDIGSLHKWSYEDYTSFWAIMLNRLNIVLKHPYSQICDLSQGIEAPIWLASATLNITDACFTAPNNTTAIIHTDSDQKLHRLTYHDLDKLSNDIAYSLEKKGYRKGDAIAIAMPMNHYAVAIYLGIIKMGGVVVSIADSFSASEMATRLKIANAKLVFTQDVIPWEGKCLPLYEKVRSAFSDQVIVIAHQTNTKATYSPLSLSWEQFLVSSDHYQSVACEPMAACNILFSSGTTGEPKAIVWNHTTPIKAASDAYLHHDIHPGDVLAWPTNLGWMMGPWLVFAALINRATIALCAEAPKHAAYGQFIQDAKVTLLGVVPTLVATWRQSQCMESFDWRTIKCFASTGECSNPEDMLYLMSLAHYKPVMEYCGGTEIGGAYLSSTLLQKNYPSLFSTPTFGLAIELLDENGKPANLGEVAILPPSIGLSTQLLNADHHATYFKDMPQDDRGITWRRHGDLLEKLPNGYYLTLGRIDDTMNLNGIKVSAVEIERVLAGGHSIIETAAIAVPSHQQGPNELIIYAATTSSNLDKIEIKKIFQQRINKQLNPFFKIHDIVFVRELPKTASNKIMRRVLRQNYLDAHSDRIA